MRKALWLGTAIALFAFSGACQGHAPTPGPRRAETLHAHGGGARNYESQAQAPGGVRGALSSEVARALQTASQARGQALRADARLGRLAAAVAAHVAPDGSLPPQEALDLFARHEGLIEPTPHFLVIAADGPSAALEEHLTKSVAQLLSEQTYTHFGAFVTKREHAHLFVLAFGFRFVEIEPIPRRAEPGRAIVLRGALTHGHASPELAITHPDGQVTRAQSATPAAGTKQRASFAFRVPLPSVGVYRIELLAQGEHGTTVVANFPVFVGVEPRTQVRVPATGGPIDGDYEVHMLSLVNADRAAAGLPPLRPDAALSDVARAHVADMLAHGFVGHTSKTTGSAQDRVARAGIRTGVVLENIGRGYSLREVHEGLKASPGHRANLMSADATHIGIGIIESPEGTHRSLLVTQVFIRVTPPLSEDATQTALQEINRARARSGRRTLLDDAALRRAAERAASRYFATPSLSDAEVLRFAQSELERTLKTPRKIGAMLIITSGLSELTSLPALLDPDARSVGIGLSQGTREDGAENAICAVVLLGL